MRHHHEQPAAPGKPPNKNNNKNEFRCRIGPPRFSSLCCTLQSKKRVPVWRWQPHEGTAISIATGSRASGAQSDRHTFLEGTSNKAVGEPPALAYESSVHPRRVPSWEVLRGERGRRGVAVRSKPERGEQPGPGRRRLVLPRQLLAGSEVTDGNHHHPVRMTRLGGGGGGGGRRAFGVRPGKRRRRNFRHDRTCTVSAQNDYDGTCAVLSHGRDESWAR